MSFPLSHMKLKPLFIVVAVFCSAVSAVAAEEIVGGPKGGRLLDAHGQKAEFFVTNDKKIEITFYDAEMKPTAPGEQVVAVTAEPKSGRTRVALAKTATGYVSKAPVPEGMPYRVVVQMRAKPDAKPQNFRVDLDLENCGGCNRAEYACTCDE